MSKVKEYRIAYGISMEEAAKVMGITRPTYVTRESGKTEFSKVEMEKFVNYLKEKIADKPITIQDIFFD